MIFNINDFRSNTGNGFQKLEHYRIRFPIPILLNTPGSLNFTTNTLRSLEYYADSVDLAGVNLATRQIVRYGYGTSEKKPIAATFNDLMVTFYSDANGDNLLFFRTWLNAIANFNMSKGIQDPSVTENVGIVSYELEYKDNYAVDAWLTQFDISGNITSSMTLRELYPVHITETKLGYALTQDIMRITVIFAITDWYNGSVDSPQQTPTQPPQQDPQASPIGQIDTSGQLTPG